MGNELFFEGKKYISARRASQITGYNSDYIGQLCRKGSLECRLVGRSWFVEEKSLENHKSEASKTPRGRIPIYLKNKGVDLSPKKLEVKGEEKPEIVETIGHENKPENITPENLVTPVFETEFETNLAFRPYDHNPFLDLQAEKNTNSSFARKISAVSVLIIVCIFSATILIQGNHVEKIDVAHQAAIKISHELDSNISVQMASAVSSMKDSSLGFFFDAEAIHELRLKTHRLTLKSYHYFSILPNMFFDTAHNMKKIVMREGEKIYDAATSVDVGEVDSMGEAVGVEPAEAGIRAGVTVVPSSGDASKDEKIKQYIKDSFSDETNVVPDDTGTSGVIKPVFKKQNNEDYLYVIVPVKD